MKRVNKVISIFAVIALSSVACSQPEQASSDELTKVQVGVLPIVDVAPLYLGMNKGIFEKHGLEVTPVTAQGGSAIVPAVQSGQMQFGFSNVTSMVVARDKGLEIKLVAPASGSTGVDGNDYTAVMAIPGEGIDEPADLLGKRVAVNTVGNILDSTVKASLRKSGLDATKVNFVEMAFPDMPAQLTKGNVDAIVVSEPFVSVAKADGAEVVLSNYAQATDDLTVAAYFATEDYIEKNPETVQSFQEAMKEAQALAAENEDQVREVLPEYTGMEDSVAQEVTLCRYPQALDPDSVKDVADMAQTDGLIKDTKAAEQLLLD